jgi:hypothetical protein
MTTTDNSVQPFPTKMWVPKHWIPKVRETSPVFSSESQLRFWLELFLELYFSFCWRSGNRNGAELKGKGRGGWIGLAPVYLSNLLNHNFTYIIKSVEQTLSSSTIFYNLRLLILRGRCRCTAYRTKVYLARSLIQPPTTNFADTNLTVDHDQPQNAPHHLIVRSEKNILYILK